MTFSASILISVSSYSHFHLRVSEGVIFLSLPLGKRQIPALGPFLCTGPFQGAGKGLLLFSHGQIDFVKFAKVRYFNYNWLRPFYHPIPTSPLSRFSLCLIGLLQWLQAFWGLG